MNRILPLSALFLIVFIVTARAGDTATSYVDLKDAPNIEVDWSRGDTQAVTLGGNRILTFSHGQRGGKYTLILKQDATGSRTVTWPSSVRWAGVLGPTLSTTANKTDYVNFFFNGVSYDMVGISQGL